MRCLQAFSTCLAVVAFPLGVSASSAVLAPVVGGDRAVSMEAREAARRIAGEVLEGEGWTVFDAAEVSASLSPELALCGPDGACALELRALLGADVAVALRLYGHGDEVSRVAVLVFGARGVVHRHEAEVDPEAGLPFAIAEPLRATLSTVNTGRSEGPPSVTPAVVRVDPSVRVERSPLNWFLGGFLVLGSAPLLGYGINTLARDGECVAPGPGDTCTERIRFEEGAGLFLGLGAIVLASGLFVLIAQPIPLFVHVTPESASLGAGGTF